ncbi:MAG: hypothetical protein ABSH08_15405, partial [Tepidisphaeraceae bacterium]
MRTKLTAIKDLRLWLGLSAFVILTGCSHNAQTPSVHILYGRESLDAAAQEAGQEADNADPQDKLVYLFEESTIQRAAGHPDISEAILDIAYRMIVDFEQQAKALPSQQAASLLADPEAADYRGHAYDRIMAATYQALDALELDDLSGARAALTRAEEQQRNAVADHQMEIAVAQQWAQQDNSQFDENAASKDPQFLYNFNRQYAPLNAPDLSGYSDYVNPFSEYLRGLYLMTDGANPGEREQAVSVLRHVAEMVKDNPYIAQDAELAGQVASGFPVPPTTYVIFETGLAPSRDETRISYPLILRGNQGPPVKQVNAVFPVLVRHACNNAQLTVVTSGGGSYSTAVVCDMDKVVAAEFRNELPIVMTASLISSATKAIGLRQIDQAMDEAWLNDPLIRTCMQQIRDFVIKDFTHADTRAWKSLPKMFSVAEFPTPSDRTITLTFLNG